MGGFLNLGFDNAGQNAVGVDHLINASIGSGIEDALSALGDEAKNALLFYIAKRFGLRQEEFPANPVKLGHALASILGNGAQTVEDRIVNELNGNPRDPMQNKFVETMIQATRNELSLRNYRRKLAENAGQN